MKAHIFLLTILTLTFFPLTSLAAEQAWDIELDPPAAHATLAGTAVFKDVQGQAWLRISYFQNPGDVSAGLIIDSSLAESFPTGIYEGPGGRAEELPLLLVAVDKADNAVAFFASGTWQFNDPLQQNLVFQWSFGPSQADIERWLNTPNRIVTVYIQQKDNTAPPLEASFLMPPSSQNVM